MKAQGADTTECLLVDERANRVHDLTNCHDIRHNGLDCPTCDGVKIACRTHQTSSTAATAPPLATVEAGTTSGGSSRTSPHGSPRSDVNPEDRVTLNAPFTIEQTITRDDIHLVTVRLTDDAARQLARDLTRRHMADLVLLARLQTMIRRPHASAETVETHHRVMDRIAGALAAHATTAWELTLPQAEQLLEDLESAASEPEICIVGTCTSYADAGSYCGPHADGV
ncbi:hypothetical protein [Janibacter terrae]|uniref:hypothetical protein n=1 Tax=Janibacter terrae TaxID=103817 RepID=UPI0031F8B380